MTIESLNQAGEAIFISLLQSIPLILAIVLAIFITAFYMWFMLALFYHFLKVDKNDKKRTKGRGAIHKTNTLSDLGSHVGNRDKKIINNQKINS